MDIINNLLEQNIERAIHINQVLVKNEEQLSNIELEQVEIANKNKESSKLLTSWSDFFSSIWQKANQTFSKFHLTKHFNTKIFKPQSSKIDNTIIESNKNLDLNCQIKTLKSLTDNMSHMLDNQNVQLQNIEETNKDNLKTLTNNVIEIQKIISI